MRQIHLEQAEQLQNFLWFGRDFVDSTNSNNKNQAIWVVADEQPFIMGRPISFNLFLFFLQMNLNRNNDLLIFQNVSFCSLYIFIMVMAAWLHIIHTSLNTHSPSSKLQQPAWLLAMRHASPWVLQTLGCTNSFQNNNSGGKVFSSSWI